MSAEEDRPRVATPQETRRAIEELVERFARNLDVYTRPDYKETQVRVEFFDPFFEVLGWDVLNVKGYAEQYKDVVPAYQVRRYAWSAKLPLSILTDFEDFAVYDCRLHVQPTDNAGESGGVLCLQSAWRGNAGEPESPGGLA